jgi:hypothetical protein
MGNWGHKMNEPDYEAIIGEQLAMNERTWKSLVAGGVTAETILKLDFFFVAPNKVAADSLVFLLNEETDYAVASPRSAGHLWRTQWSVSGSTKETRLTAKFLDEWVSWMVIAGKRSKGCVFDGWGTEFPDQAPRLASAPPGTGAS